MRAVILIALCSSVLAPPAAIACSLVPGVDLGTPRGRIGPNPLLVSDQADARLIDDRGQNIPLSTAPAPGVLADARAPDGRALFFFRAQNPLADGTYDFDSGRNSLTVAATTAPEPASLGTNPTVALYLGNKDGGSSNFGCGGSVSSCGDTTNLTVTLAGVPFSQEDGAIYLLTFEVDGVGTVKRLVTDRYGFGANTELRMYNAFAESGHFSEHRICTTLAGVAFDGTVGETKDLGCLDPDENDPRITRSTGSGCSTTRGDEVPTLWMLVCAMGVAMLRRRRL